MNNNYLHGETPNQHKHSKEQTHEQQIQNDLLQNIIVVQSLQTRPTQGGGVGH